MAFQSFLFYIKFITFFLLSFFSSVASFANDTIDIELFEIEKLENQLDTFVKTNDNTNAKNKALVQHQLNLMFDLDQKIRAYGMQNGYCSNTKQIPDSFSKILKRVDEKNTQKLKKLLEKEIWITISKFGQTADNHAWILVQHADCDLAFQKDILNRLEKLYPCGESDGKHYAYLYDRIARNEGRPQRYGTQGKINEIGKWEAFEIEDINNLNRRRDAVKLGSFEDYQKLINQQFNQ